MNDKGEVSNVILFGLTGPFIIGVSRILSRRSVS